MNAAQVMHAGEGLSIRAGAVPMHTATAWQEACRWLCCQRRSATANSDVRHLRHHWLYYSVETGGEFHTPLTGISRGCALRPLSGVSLSYHVDACFASCREVFYVRYMDDFLLLTETRWALRRAIKQRNTFMALGGFNAHPEKTQIGRPDKGFDWLGVWFGPAGAVLAPRALNNHRDRRLRLHEQARYRGLSAASGLQRVQAYETRWALWAESLLRAAR